MLHHPSPARRVVRSLAMMLAAGAAWLAWQEAAWALGPLAKKAPAARKAPPGKKAPPAAPAEGTLLASSREVQVRPDAGAEWKELEIGQSLARRDRLRTGKGGTATLDAGAGRLWFDPGTQVLLLGETVKKGKAGVELSEGALRAAVDTSGPGGKARLLRVQAGDAEVRVRGAARVQLGANPGDLQVAVFEGSAEIVSKKGAPIKLAANTGASLRRGAKARVGGLIGAPSWEGGGGLHFAVPQRGGAVSAELQLPFKGVQGAVRYRLEVARDEAMTDRVHVGLVPADGKFAVGRVPGKGRYFARLQAVDGDQVLGPGPTQPVLVAEVRGERLGAAQTAAAAGQPRALLLTGAGELAFELVPASPAGGRLQVQLDGKAVASEGSVVPLRVGRGLHQVQVSTESGVKGELRVEVSRPSYAVEIGQDKGTSESRPYRVEVRALDAGGQGAAGSVGVQARLGQLGPEKGQGKAPAEGQPLALSLKGPGIYVGQLEVPAGQTLRLSIHDGDGTVASADLTGPGAP